MTLNNLADLKNHPNFQLSPEEIQEGILKEKAEKIQARKDKKALKNAPLPEDHEDVFQPEDYEFINKNFLPKI